jgi:SAM-dependent methyltransferase
MGIIDFFKGRKDLNQSEKDLASLPKNGSEIVIQEMIFKGAKGEPKTYFIEGEPLTIQFYLKVCVPISFNINITLSIYHLPNQYLISKDNMQRDGVNITWLPQGHHLIEWKTSELLLRHGSYSFVAELGNLFDNKYRMLDSKNCVIEVHPSKYLEGCISFPHEWSFTTDNRINDSKGLSWQKGHKDWFYKHFDHAANVVIEYMFDHSPLLKGKILDVGCGEGITDLGIFLRVEPKLLVGIDIEGNFKELPRIMKENGLPFLEIPKNLIFRKLDAREIPYPDDYFNVVISWALLEHVPGGYEGVLKEIKRVLKDGGLLFLHPGLYYSSSGHHLGEFSSEPFVHLKKTHQELKEIVFTTKPNYIDRGGLQYTPEDFWRYYTELNKITVSEIEQKLRKLKFEFKRMAVRAEDLVIYDEHLQNYSIQDLTTQEIYMSLINRKN